MTRCLLLWKKHKVERREESKKRKTSSYSRGRKDCKVGKLWTVKKIGKEKRRSR